MSLKHPLADWADECCTVHKDAEALSGDLFEDFSEWAYARGAPHVSKHRFGTLLKATPGITEVLFRRLNVNGRGYRGIALREPAKASK